MMDEWEGGKMRGWMDGLKAILRIAYSNQKAVYQIEEEKLNHIRKKVTLYYLAFLSTRSDNKP